VGLTSVKLAQYVRDGKKVSFVADEETVAIKKKVRPAK
jgi:hypothetical protein